MCFPGWYLNDEKKCRQNVLYALHLNMKFKCLHKQAIISHAFHTDTHARSNCNYRGISTKYIIWLVPIFQRYEAIYHFLPCYTFTWRTNHIYGPKMKWNELIHIGKDLKMALWFVVYTTQKRKNKERITQTHIKTKHLYQLWKRKETWNIHETAPTISTETYFKYIKSYGIVMTHGVKKKR